MFLAVNTRSDIAFIEKATNISLKGYSDADRGNSSLNRRSYTGYFFELAGPIAWESRKQPTIALSSAEAEYMALASATKEACYLRRLITKVNSSLPSYFTTGRNLSPVATPVATGPLSTRTLQVRRLRRKTAAGQANKGKPYQPDCYARVLRRDHCPPKRVAALGPAQVRGCELSPSSAVATRDTQDVSRDPHRVIFYRGCLPRDHSPPKKVAALGLAQEWGCELSPSSAAITVLGSPLPRTPAEIPIAGFGTPAEAGTSHPPPRRTRPIADSANCHGIN
ncbi:hypothetical protein evm_000984 [Chilo suppressalis]|nr:hypothetical protein evm_000984 [Chilo suppressalis]